MTITRTITIACIVTSCFAAAACTNSSESRGDASSSNASSSAAPDKFTVEPTETTVEGETVLLFTYPTVRASRLDAAKVSDDGRMLGSKGVPWHGEPHFFRKENVIALYVGSNARVIDALRAQYGEQFAGQ